MVALFGFFQPPVATTKHVKFGNHIFRTTKKVIIISVYETKFCPTFCWLYWEDRIKLQYNFFGRIFVTPFLVKIVNFIGYANNATTDVIVYDE